MASQQTIQPSVGKKPGVILPAPDQQGPQDQFCETAGAAAPSGAPHAARNDEANDLPEQGPQDRLCRTAGAAAPSGGSEPHAVGSVGAIFHWPVRVYWEDTDAGGIVFYANYLKFFERSRTEWLRSMAIEQQALKDSTGCMFVVIDAAIRYHRPARLDDELLVTSSLIDTGRASMTLHQQALLKPQLRGLPGTTLLCSGTVRVGWVDAASMQPRRIPASILDSLKP